MIICLPSCDAAGCRRAFGCGHHASGAAVGACHPSSVGAGACFASFGVVVGAYHPGFAAAGA